MSGRCFYSEKCQSLLENTNFIFSGNNTGGDSTFSYYQCVSYVSYYNVSFCFGTWGIASGEFYDPIINSFIKFGYIFKNSEFCAFGTWITSISGSYINFIDLSLSECLGWGHGSFYLDNSIIWNCKRILYSYLGSTPTLNLFFQNCFSDYIYKTGITQISTLTTHEMTLILCSLIISDQSFQKIVFLKNKILFLVNILL